MIPNQEDLTVTKAMLYGAASVDIRPYLTGMKVDLDVDRVPFGRATLTLEGAPQAVLDQSDPRRTAGVNVGWSVMRRPGLTADLSTADYLPGPLPDGTMPQDALMMLRRSEWDALTDTLTLECSTREAWLTDMIRIAGNTQDTAAINVSKLVEYAINAAYGGGGAFLDWSNLTSFALPAGDRRLMQPGESCWDLIETELTNADSRLYGDLAAGAFITSSRANPPRPLLWPDALIATTSADATGDLLVTNVTKTLDRDAWANAALVKYSYTTGSGTSVVSYQSSGFGAAKAVSVEYDRAPSSGNLALGIATRAAKRGSAFSLTAGLNFNARPGRTVTLRRPGKADLNLGMIRAVEWDLATAEMTIRTEIGQPA